MARTGKAENQQANSQYSAQQEAALGRTNAATDKYNQLLDTLRSGKSIAPNPYADSGYLANQNLLTSAATSASNKGASEMLGQEARRTGENTAGRRATIADLGRQAMRTRTDYTAGRSADDYQKYLDYQKFILGSTLAPTGADTSIYQAATGGRSGSLKSLADMGIASQQMWGNIIGAGLQGAGTAAAKGCWIAEAIWSPTDWRTFAVREWLNTDFVKSLVGKLVMAFYLRFGRKIAAQVKKRLWLKRLLKPLFELALKKALKAKFADWT